MLQPSSPIIVWVIDAPVRGLGDVLINAIGLAGALALGGVLFGVALAGVFVAYQKLKAHWSPPSETSATQSLGLTPVDKA